MMEDDGPIIYQILEGTSACGKDTLVDSLGFQYTKKVNRRRANTTWRCYLRTKSVTCKATVLQKDGTFIRGLHEHICGIKPGCANVAIIRRKIKLIAMERPFDSAAEIVDQVLRDDIGIGQIALHPTLPKPRNLARQANLKRKLSRPNQPSDLRFNLDEEHIAPAFLQDDIVMDGGRHILFATAHMLDMLGRSRVWFLDGTFKSVREPFYQLFSVHSFIRSGTTEKQVPLAFAIMSGKRIVDYAAVLRSILRILPVTNVQKVVTDFESSIWQALRDVMPDVQVTGCLFHYTQAVYRRAQDFGLGRDYRIDAGTHMIVRQLLSLPILPLEHVNQVFQRIELSAGENQAILQMMEYMRSYWLQGNVFTPRDWVVYRQDVRTNNDLEGWHHRLNHRAKRANIQFYMLCQLLYEESQTVSINAELISFSFHFFWHERQGLCQ